MNIKIAVPGFLSVAGLSAAGIYLSIPAAEKQEKENNKKPQIKGFKANLSSEQQEEYKGRYKKKLPELDLLDYSDEAAWNEASERLINLVILPLGLATVEAGKSNAESTRDWCYSVADKEWSEDSNDEERIKTAASQVCQRPKAQEQEETPSQREEDFSLVDNSGIEGAENRQ